MKKKILALVLALTMCFSIIACGNAENTDNTTNKSAATGENETIVTGDKDILPDDSEEQTKEDDAETADSTSTEAKNADDSSKEETKEEKSENKSPLSAVLFAQNLKVGWNLGNTLDAYIDGQNSSDPLYEETCWGNPKTTKAMMDTIKAEGFNSVRIPVSWHPHVIVTESAGQRQMTIESEWLERVKEIVDYAYDNDMYVIINIHHDNEPDYANGIYGYIPDYEHKDDALWYVTSVWEIVADYFKDYDEHLIFESLNEPRLTNDDVHEWWLDTKDEHCREAMDVINQMNQAIVDVIRASGGQNAERYITVPGYCASVDGANALGFILPDDTVPDRMFVTLHAYVPYNFALNEDLQYDYFNADNTEYTDPIDNVIKIAVTKYKARGIPVIIDEFGCLNKNSNTKSRVEYYKYYVSKCAKSGIPCFVWDNGIFEGNDNRFAIFDRNTLTFPNKEVKDAIINSWN